MNIQTRLTSLFSNSKKQPHTFTPSKAAYPLDPKASPNLSNILPQIPPKTGLKLAPTTTVALPPPSQKEKKRDKKNRLKLSLRALEVISKVRASKAAPTSTSAQKATKAVRFQKTTSDILPHATPTDLELGGEGGQIGGEEGGEGGVEGANGGKTEISERTLEVIRKLRGRKNDEWV